MCAREAKWTDKLSEKMSERQTAGLEPEGGGSQPSRFDGDIGSRCTDFAEFCNERGAERLSKPERFYSTEDFIGF